MTNFDKTQMAFGPGINPRKDVQPVKKESSIVPVLYAEIDRLKSRILELEAAVKEGEIAVWNAAILKASEACGDAWNDSSTMVNQKAQAKRMRDVVFSLRREEPRNNALLEMRKVREIPEWFGGVVELDHSITRTKEAYDWAREKHKGTEDSSHEQ